MYGIQGDLAPKSEAVVVERSTVVGYFPSVVRPETFPMSSSGKGYHTSVR